VVDVAHGCYDTEPAPRVFGELGIRRLEENLHPIEGPDDCFGLVCESVLLEAHVI